jgi:hypothetical protein
MIRSEHIAEQQRGHLHRVGSEEVQEQQAKAEHESEDDADRHIALVQVFAHQPNADPSSDGRQDHAPERCRADQYRGGSPGKPHVGQGVGGKGLAAQHQEVANQPRYILDASKSLLDELTTALGVPRNVLADDDQIRHAWSQFPRLLTRIPPARQRLPSAPGTVWDMWSQSSKKDRASSSPKSDNWRAAPRSLTRVQRPRSKRFSFPPSACAASSSRKLNSAHARAHPAPGRVDRELRWRSGPCRARPGSRERFQER